MTALTMAATSAPRGMAPQLEPALWKPGDRAAPVSISCAILPLRRRSSAFVVSFPRGLATWRMDRRASPVVASVATEEATGVLEPKPTVLIDQDSDADATIVEISFGDRLGALLDTIKALKDLGLNVIKGVVTSEGGNLRRKKFLVTRADNNKKVENPELLEAIRLTIINNLLKYHPESGEQLALGVAFGGHPPEQELDVDVATHISVTREGGRSLLSVETADRPGLLLEILNVICDISIYVESAEIDTMGLVAKDKFYVTYHGEQLSPSMEEVLTNSLVYYLRRPDTEEDSY